MTNVFSGGVRVGKLVSAFLFRGLFLFPSPIFPFPLPFLSLFLFFSGVAFFEFPLGFAQ